MNRLVRGASLDVTVSDAGVQHMKRQESESSPLALHRPGDVRLPAVAAIAAPEDDAGTTPSHPDSHTALDLVAMLVDVVRTMQERMNAQDGRIKELEKRVRNLRDEAA